MTSETPNDPLRGATFHGFSSPGAPSPIVSAPARTPLPMLLAGVGGACVLGLVLGLWAKPDFGTDGRERGSMKPVTQPVAAQPQDQVKIVVDRNEPLPAVQGGKLELMPDVARPAPAAVAVRPAAITPVREIAPPTAGVPRPLARGPSFDCRSAATVSEEMICGDSGLAAQDRRLAASWRQAHAAGVPPGRLRRQQDRWLAARDDAAAQGGPSAVADIYDQRIAELDDMAAMGDFER